MTRPVCVLGMMRTGTSVVAGVLEALGVNFGPVERLLAPNDANPLGFREHTGIIALNDGLLDRYGGTWYSPPDLPIGWEADPGLDDFRSQATTIISNDLKPLGMWGWKDPRCCLTLPFWQRLVGSITYIVCIRDPVESARSLAALPWARRRIEDPYRRGLDLWLRYTADAIALVPREESLVVRYDEVIRDVTAQAVRIALVSGIPASTEQAHTSAALREVVQPTLHHQRASIKECRDFPEHPAHELYRRLVDGTGPQ